jgi:hypothetical protein
MPAFSLKDLGATPFVKGVVYLALGVIGTVETVAWTQWGYRRWWKGADEAKAADDQGQNGVA